MIKAPHSLTLKRTYPHPRAKVFNAFTQANRLARWLSPAPDVPMKVLSLEFEINGRFRFHFTNTDGSASVVGGRFQKIVSPIELEFTWMWEAPHTYEDVMTVVSVEFFSKGEDTELVLTHTKLSSKESCELHAAGWGGALDQLGGNLD